MDLYVKVQSKKQLKNIKYNKDESVKKEYDVNVLS